MSQSSSDPPSNPGGFPFSPEDAMQFMQRMWNPFGVPIPGFPLPGTTPAAGSGVPGLGAGFPNPATMFATLDPAEIERKIAELHVIENWLEMSLNLMRMSIKTMELQKASLEALRAAQPAGASSASPPEKPGRK